MICNSCGEERKEEDFVWKKIGVKRSSQCKFCTRQNSRKHYYNNKKYYYLRNKRRREDGLLSSDNRMFICEYLLSHPCVDCGESDIVVLDFDHVSGKKEKEISLMNEASKQKLVEELDKCEVRCSNCHRRRHAKESKSFRFLFSERQQRRFDG